MLYFFLFDTLGDSDLSTEGESLLTEEAFSASGRGGGGGDGNCGGGGGGGIPDGDDGEGTTTVTFSSFGSSVAGAVDAREIGGGIGELM